MEEKFKKIYIEITNICNLSCEFCEADGRNKEYMTKGNFEYILEQIKGYTKYIYLHVKGEPLMHPEINEFIDIAYSKGFKVNITTNGTLIGRLKTKNIRQINYSMQSEEDVRKIRETVKELKEFVKNTSIYLSLRLWRNKTKGNLELIKLLKGEFGENVDISDRNTIAENIFISIEEEFEWPDMEKEKRNVAGYCYGLKDHIAILVDGTVIPCCLDHKGNINLGNIFNSTMQNILNNARVGKMLEGFKSRVIVEELCKRCTFKNKF